MRRRRSSGPSASSSDTTATTRPSHWRIGLVFGLRGGIISADVGRAYEMALRIRSGGVTLNGGAGTQLSSGPFGGIKRSGYGRELGEEGLNEFTQLKLIEIQAG